MKGKTSDSPAIAAIGAAVVGTLLITAPSQAGGNPFAIQALDSGYRQLADHNQCGAGKCGGPSGVDGKCGGGQCGSNMGGRCGIGKCGGTPLPEDDTATSGVSEPADRQ